MRRFFHVRHGYVVCLTVALAAITGGCHAADSDLQREGDVTMPRSIEQVQQAHTDAWMAIPGVEGTGIGLYKGKPCIKVFASKKPEELRGKIPSVVEGYPVVIEQTGTFRALERE